MRDGFFSTKIGMFRAVKGFLVQFGIAGDPAVTAKWRKRGGLPKVSFPLLLSLARTKRKRAFSARGNLVGAPTAVAMVERDCITSYVTKQLRCRCGGRLGYCRQASTQVGVGAAWQFVCERSCKLPPMVTGKALHGDD